MNEGRVLQERGLSVMQIFAGVDSVFTFSLISHFIK